MSIRDLSYQVFKVTNDNHSVNLTTSELVARFYEGVDVKKELTQGETFNSNAKAKIFSVLILNMIGVTT